MTAKKTALYEKHISLGAQMVEFSKTLLPVRFRSEIEEHMAVRTGAGIFDVSHMGEFLIEESHARDFLQGILTNNIDLLAVGQAQYSLLLNHNAGIIDDLIVYRLDDNVYLLCVNAGNIERDWQHINEHRKQFAPCDITDVSTQYAQFALQGPRSSDVLSLLCSEILPTKFTIKSLKLDGITALVARTGYTGEDGFEIFIKNDDAPDLYDRLLLHGKAYDLMPCGLASRDSLRLEAGLLLHGQDMDETITPKEVGLMFAVDVTKDDFIGKRALEAFQPSHKLVGFKLLDKGIARHDFAVLDEDLQLIGKVTSATYLPHKKMAIGFALVDERQAMPGKKILVDIRGRHAIAEICSMRFLKH